ncbi:MAG: hypothetical protein H6925_00070 [Holosporaceae bacterium]|nr:MAG: hypothetical protein H6925_00070 [Holosporaceae bacterium]
MTKALLIHPYLYTEKFTLMRQPTDKMAELISLSEAIQLEVLDTSILKISEIKPATYIGLGAVQTIQEQVQKLKIDLVVVNAPLHPFSKETLRKDGTQKLLIERG